MSDWKTNLERAKAACPPGMLVMLRDGDFYCFFGEDAEEAAGVLGLCLTKRTGVPLCGVPYHAADDALLKLIRAGKKVALADEVTR